MTRSFRSVLRSVTLAIVCLASPAVAAVATAAPISLEVLEPATMMLVGCGLAGMVAARKRRRSTGRDI